MRLENIRTNNLKGFDLSVDPRQVVLLCGVSGSGKSSLAFDTIYAAGQQRFVETLSTSARELLSNMPPPEVDRIDNVPPTLALRQDDIVVDQRATVGSATDLHDLLASLFATAGTWRCPECDQPLGAATTKTVCETIADQADGATVLIGFPTAHLGASQDEQLEMLSLARFTRAVIGGRVVKLANQQERITSGPILGLVDRVRVGKSDPSRVSESVAAAFRAGAGQCVIMVQDGSNDPGAMSFNERLSCQLGHVPEDPPDLACLLPFSPRGACNTCQGTSTTGDGATCPECDGCRLGSWAGHAEYGGLRFSELVRTPIASVRTGSFLDIVGEFEGQEAVESIQRRVDALYSLGLGHLTMARGLASLSTGDRLRVRLASLWAADVVETLFVLDEPTAGLHQSEVSAVTELVKDLKDRGNGVVVIDHTPAFVSAADRVIELGPSAGRDGGEVVFDGSAEAFAQAETATAIAFRRLAELPVGKPDDEAGSVDRDVVRVRSRSASSGHSLPYGALSVVTGKTGSGKSRLLGDLAAAEVTDFEFAAEREVDLEEKRPAEAFAGITLVQPEIAGRQPRSCLATQTKAYDEIRKLFAATPEAHARGLTARHFSFNSAGSGRCGYCSGRGFVHVDMGHLSSLKATCPRCGGLRFEADIRAIKYRRRSISDVLAMTVDEAVAYFRTEIRIRRRLQPIRDVGLGYVTLGQSLSTLSGGERQRLQLALHLGPTSRGQTLFLLDEPARGLHPDDVETLIKVFEKLIDVGHTVVVADNHPMIARAAAHVIKLDEQPGPEGRDAFAGRIQ